MNTNIKNTKKIREEFDISNPFSGISNPFDKIGNPFGDLCSSNLSIWSSICCFLMLGCVFMIVLLK